MRKLIIPRAETASEEEFVQHWSARYRDQKYNEETYTKHIGRPLTKGGVEDLFRWKNGMRLSANKEKAVADFIARIDELNRLPMGTSAKEFLDVFVNGGAIWRIFWLHCWQPNKYPIYDQHVHRAMSVILTEQPQEPPETDRKKIEAYLQRYIPFCSEFETPDKRSVDRALWTFGKYIKEWGVPN